jgi:hypothetical protein
MTERDLFTGLRRPVRRTCLLLKMITLMRATSVGPHTISRTTPRMKVPFVASATQLNDPSSRPSVATDGFATQKGITRWDPTIEMADVPAITDWA